MKTIQYNPYIIDPLSGILNILWVNDWGIYSFGKESKYIAAFLSINNKAQRVILPFLTSRFMTYTSSFILGKLFLEKTSSNLGS